MYKIGFQGHRIAKSYCLDDKIIYTAGVTNFVTYSDIVDSLELQNGFGTTSMVWELPTLKFGNFPSEDMNWLITLHPSVVVT